VVVPEKQGLKPQKGLPISPPGALYKWWFQKNKDWNPHWNQSWQQLEWYKWWFQKNKDWNIWTSKGKAVPFRYKWWFQKNKDWNPMCRSRLESGSGYKWWFQKNKDWNQLVLLLRLPGLSCISGGSRKTRIETARDKVSRGRGWSISGGSRKTRIETGYPPPAPAEPAKYKWWFQKNKDWNNFAPASIKW